MVVLECTLKRDGFSFPQLYYRAINEQQYHPVVEVIRDRANARFSDIACQTAVLCGESRVAFLISEYAFSAAGYFAKGKSASRKVAPVYSIGIGLIDFRDLKADIWDARKGDWFVTELLSGERDDLYGVIGVQGSLTDGTRTTSYHLARLNWSSRTVTQIAPFGNVFY